jgi:hypothetical protein
MGASVSRNTAEAMASVTNTVDNSTTVTNNNITTQANEINLNQCFVDVKNSINVQQYAEQLAKNKQITQGMSNTDLKNDIQQKMMQEAMSSVGSMGIGFADASNSASMFASATSTVTNTVADTATNIANSKNQINCNDSVIRAGNIDINQGLSNEYSNDQVAKSDNVTKIATTISQTAQQKATAKVAGLAGFLIALAILIVAMGWSFSEVAESVPGVKAIVLIVAFFVFVAILLILYVYKVPPLFNDPLQCSPNFSYSTGKNECSSSCVNVSKQDVLLDHTPMKYIFSIVEDPPSNSGTTGSLFKMIVSSQSSTDDLQNNQGYTASNATKINDNFKNFLNSLGKNIVDPESVPDILNIATIATNKYMKIPDQFMKAGDNGKSCTPQSIQIASDGTQIYNGDSDNCGILNGVIYKINENDTTSTIQQGGASLNITKWKDYANKNPGLARFLLLRFIESPDDQLKIDLSMYEDESDPVVYKENNVEKIDLAKNVKDKATYYRNDKNPKATAAAKSGSGKLTGLYGVCHNQSYKLQVGMRKVFWYTLPTILMIFFMYEIIRYHGKGATFNDWIKPISAIIVIYVAFILIMSLLWKPWGK